MRDTAANWAKSLGIQGEISYLIKDMTLFILIFDVYRPPKHFPTKKAVVTKERWRFPVLLVQLLLNVEAADVPVKVVQFVLKLYCSSLPHSFIIMMKKICKIRSN